MRPTRPTLRFESLEDRTVPATLDLTSHGAVAAAGPVVFTQYDGRLGDPAKLKTFAELDGPLLRAAAVQGYNTDARPTQFNENTSSNLTRAQIQQQAGTAMLAQANQLPQMVLQLLK